MRSSFRLLAVLALVACGGGGDDDDDDDDVVGDPDAGASATMVFNPPSAGNGAEWGAIPYPSDLFLDSAGRLSLLSLPTGPNADSGMIEMMTDALDDLDGAGVWSSAYFPVSGDIDPANLAGAVHLVNLDDGLKPVAVDVVWRADLGAIVAVPTRGTILRETTRYGAYVTRAAGAAPTSLFLEAIDLDAVPGDAGAAAAQQTLRPLIEALDGATVDQLAAATVFTTASVTGEMKAMRDALAAAPPIVTVVDVVGPDAAELDAVFGVQDPAAPPGWLLGDVRGQPHGNVAALIHGDIDLASFLHADPHTAGRVEFSSGVPQVKGTHSVRYTLTLPKTATSYADTPVIVYMHGINRTRIDLMIQADAAAALGYAVLAVDIMHHGHRSKNFVDAKNDLTGDAVPDGFGDLEGLFPAVDFFHLLPSGGIPAYHPAMMRDNLRQAAADVSSLVAFVVSGDPAPINAALGTAGLPNDLTFRDDVGLLTESFGGMVSAVALTVDPDLGVASISSIAAGFPYPSMLHSANFSNTFAGVVLGPFDVQERTVLGDDTAGARYEPMVMLYNTAIERGDPTAFAPYLLDGSVRGDSGPNLLMTESWADEWVPNEATEIFMGAVGLSRMTLTQQDTPPGDWQRYVPLPEVSAPVSGNRASGQRTAVATVWHPASHTLPRSLDDQWEYEPDFPPFAPLEPPVAFNNPIVEMHAMWTRFFSDHFTGAVPTLIDPFAR